VPDRIGGWHGTCGMEVDLTGSDQEEIFARLDLIAQETLQGVGTRSSREAGVVLGRPAVADVDPETLPEEVVAARGAGRWSYLQLLIPFDLEEAAPGLAYLEVDIRVALHDDEVIARQLTLVRHDDPAALGALTTFGIGRGEFRWRVRPAPDGPLADGGRMARVLLQVPPGTESLTGTIDVAARLSDTELGVEVPVATRAPQPFVLSLRDGTFSPMSPVSPQSRSLGSVSLSSRRLCVTGDVEGYSRRDPGEHGRIQSVLVDVLDRALAAAGLAPGDCGRQEQGDGHLIVMPPGIDEPRVIRWFLRELESELGAANRHVRAEYAVRLRVALDEDVVFLEANGFGGDGVVRAHRLRDCAAAKAALAVARGDFIVVVSDRLYHGCVRTAFAGVPEWRFEPATATVPDKGFAEPCWIHAPAGQGAV
jgi:hypothetical protein